MLTCPTHRMHYFCSSLQKLPTFKLPSLWPLNFVFYQLHWTEIGCVVLVQGLLTWLLVVKKKKTREHYHYIKGVKNLVCALVIWMYFLNFLFVSVLGFMTCLCNPCVKLNKALLILFVCFWTHFKPQISQLRRKDMLHVALTAWHWSYLNRPHDGVISIIYEWSVRKCENSHSVMLWRRKKGKLTLSQHYGLRVTSDYTYSTIKLPSFNCYYYQQSLMFAFHQLHAAC